jgi:hypothetical protein
MAREMQTHRMKTVILQSYRTRDVAPWMDECLHSVRDWAARHGHAYEFFDDRFFDYAPAWVRELCGTEILPITDVARLYLLRDYLGRGWDRAVWVDADVLVFAPDKFILDGKAPYSLCYELACLVTPEQGAQFGGYVNNAVMFVTPNQPMLDFWIFAAEEILRTRGPQKVFSTIVGTRFFSALAGAMPLRATEDVGLFIPPLIRDIASGGGVLLDQWAAQLRKRVAAANLCASMQDRHFSGATVSAADMQKAVDVLLQTRGEVVNARMRVRRDEPAAL